MLGIDGHPSWGFSDLAEKSQASELRKAHLNENKWVDFNFWLAASVSLLFCS